MLSSLIQGRKLLIFDFDGTLVDSSPLHAKSFTQVLAPFDISVDYSSIAGMKTLDAIRHLVTSAGKALSDEQVASLVDAKQQCVRALIRQQLEPMPGVDAFLCKARSCYQLALVTSGSRATVLLALEQLGYLNWFEPLICADDVLHAKPAPDGFLMALQQSGFSAKEALVFEDSEAGFLAAKAAKLDYIDVGTMDWAQLM